MDEDEDGLVNREQPLGVKSKGVWFRFECRLAVGISDATMERIRVIVEGMASALEEAKPWLPVVLPLLALLVKLVVVVIAPYIS